MPDVFDGDGNLLADIPISHRQIGVLMAGAEVTIIFHTPQLLRPLLGARTGSFSLRRISISREDGVLTPDVRIVTREPKQVRVFAELQAAIAAARTKRETNGQGPGSV